LDRRGIFLGLGFTALVVASAACSSSGGTGSTSPPTPAPSSSSLILGTVGNIACTAPADAVPGTYAGIDTAGTVTGTTYTEDNTNVDDNDFYTNAYTPPTGGTPAPTSPPLALPSPTVAPTAPGATLAIVYYGEYSIPQTAGLTTATTNGCFALATIPDDTVSPSSVHRSRALGGGVASSLASSRLVSGAASTGRITLTGTPAPSASPYDAFGSGIPAFAYPYAVQSDGILVGNMQNFTITNLTRTTGTGSFTITTQAVGDTFNATGTVNITGSTAFYYDENSQDLFKRHPLHVRRQ
jgi:hypothetical protein